MSDIQRQIKEIAGEKDELNTELSEIDIEDLYFRDEERIFDRLIMFQASVERVLDDVAKLDPPQVNLLMQLHEGVVEVIEIRHRLENRIHARKYNQACREPTVWEALETQVFRFTDWVDFKICGDPHVPSTNNVTYKVSHLMTCWVDLKRKLLRQPSLTDELHKAS